MLVSISFSEVIPENKKYRFMALYSRKKTNFIKTLLRVTKYKIHG
jgi:hypothetical protein